MREAEERASEHRCRLEGVRARSLAELLERCGPCSEWLVADLSLGAWRGHQVARELSAQLGLAPRASGEPPDADLLEPRSPASFASVVGRWIDEESAGDRAILEAQRWADRLGAAVASSPRRRVLLLAPRTGGDWGRENVAFVSFLVRRLPPEVSFTIVATSGRAVVVPDDWDLCWQEGPEDESPVVAPLDPVLFPGVLDAAALETLPQLAHGPGFRSAPLGGGCALIDPSSRPPSGPPERLDFDRLARDSAALGWVQAFAQFGGNHMFVEPYRLCAEAWMRREEGSVDIAQRLLERAVECAPSPAQGGLLLAQLQGLRIGSCNYARAAEAADPSPAVGPDVRGFLWLSKGWGLAMSGRAGQAVEPLQRARALLEDCCGERELRYVLNIIALALARTGDLETAYELERRIERDLESMGLEDPHLEYVNNLNLARLERRMGEVEAADRHFARAFDTVAGLRSDSDRVFERVCAARTAHDAGRWEDAFDAWLLAALQWLASATPAALAPRVVQTLTGDRPSGLHATEARVSHAFERSLREAAARAALELRPEDAPGAVVFDAGARALTQEERVGAELVGRRGMGVCLFERWCAPAHAVPAPLRALERVVAAGVRAALPDAGRRSFAAIGIDDREGRGLPVSAADLIEVALRLEVDRLRYEGRELELSAGDRRGLEAASLVGLAPGVRAVETEPPRVLYRRYRAPRALSAEEAALVAEATRPTALGEIVLDRAEVDLRMLVRALERERVLKLELPSALADDALRARGQAPHPSLTTEATSGPPGS